jgi:Prokaryotic Cytochrome C oxidase subunit IV
MRALFRTWAVLVALTLAAMWLAAGGPTNRHGLIGTGLIVAITGFKAAAILRNFLELRTAPPSWQFGLYLYLAVLGGAIFAAFALSGRLA